MAETLPTDEIDQEFPGLSPQDIAKKLAEEEGGATRFSPDVPLTTPATDSTCGARLASTTMSF
jgi:hypothetical protein